ncbi:MAG: nucleoside-triphosphatase [Promethearchaeia archaeon]
MKILITGPPRSGKSTLISKLIEDLQKEYILRGFLTPEIRMNGKREGFDVKDLKTQERILLAHKKGPQSEFKLGSYNVYVENFNEYLKENLFPQLKEEKENSEKFLLVIDEIGKMELYSKLFQDFIKTSFRTNQKIIATIGKTLNHPVKDDLLALSHLKYYKLNRDHFDNIFQEISSYFD